MEHSAHPQSENPKPISHELIQSKVVFWREFFPYFTMFKFSPYGSTSLDIPSFHLENIKKVVSSATVSDYQYNLLEGRADLRQAVIDNFPEVKKFTDANIPLTFKDVSISSGAVCGINVVVERFCTDKDDEVLLFEPMYPFHMGKVALRKLGLKTVRLLYDPTTRKFNIDFEGLKKALTPKTKVMILCNPNNPACKVFTREEYKKISEIIKDYPDLVVVEDSAYFLYHDDAHDPLPFAVVNPQDFGRTFTIYSGGKMYNITGTRVGIVIGPRVLQKKIAEILPLELQLSPVFEQMVIRENLVSANVKNENGNDFYEETRRDIVKRGKYVEEEVRKLGINTTSCEGSYYIVLDIEPLRGKIDEKYYHKLDEKEKTTHELDKAFSRMIFLETKVGLFPMSELYFGENIPDHLVRVAVNRNDEDLKLLIDSLRSLVKT